VPGLQAIPNLTGADHGEVAVRTARTNCIDRTPASAETAWESGFRGTSPADLQPQACALALVQSHSLIDPTYKPDSSLDREVRFS
jgi:hypothetical protein